MWLPLFCAMKHHIIISADGSTSLQLEHFGEAYHSTNGAFTEAQHIYINCGLSYSFSEFTCRSAELDSRDGEYMPESRKIFDVGFGTGLNCILALAWQISACSKGGEKPKITYYGIEKFPIQQSEIEQFNYCKLIAEYYCLSPDMLQKYFLKIHSSPWEESVEIAEGFILLKTRRDIAQVGEEFYREAKPFDAPAVVFYDTFSPATQPELWREEIFRNIYNGCLGGTVLVTYCSKGVVKQALRNVDFEVHRLPGPPGKRHIVRAEKIIPL